MKNKFVLVGLTAVALVSSIQARSADYSASMFSATPPFLTTNVDPFVLINLSVELTQQAESFTDGEQTYANGTYCPGRANVDIDGDGDNDLSSYGICYSASETYIGYFDPNKCYDYVTVAGETEADRAQAVTGPYQGTGTAPSVSYFTPVSLADDNHTCNRKFSGNFMNWISMTALDQFRSAMTGGARLVDTSGTNAKTLLTRAWRFPNQGGWDSFIGKAIRKNGITRDGVTFATNPSTVTPFTGRDSDAIYVETNGNIGNRITFKDEDEDVIGTYNVIVEVCKESVGLEGNCAKYTDSETGATWYKPEGVLQRNALKMRYALTSYTSEDGNDVNGGVLRSNAKHIGYYRPAQNGGLEVNPVREINADGTFRFNADGATLSNGVENSGILNYINLFGLDSGRYKSNDPASEIYYEGLRYMTGLGPTASFSANAIATTSYKDGFPVLYDDEDEDTEFSWKDPVVDACQKNFMLYIGDQFTHADDFVPGKGCSVANDGACSDSKFNAHTLTNTVGSLEGKADLSNTTRSGGSGGFWIAGMTYWANTSDVRDDFAGKQTIKSFIVDTQEYSSSPPTGNNNPLWLAAKYGGFETDSWTPGTEPTEAQWDTDDDGVPNTYTLASQPANMVAGLQSAFNIMTTQINAGSAAGVTTNTAAGQGMVVQGLFKPNHVDGDKKIEWGGLLHAIFLDEHGNYREDADGDAVLDPEDPVIAYEVSQSRDKSTVSRYQFQGRLRNESDVPYESGIEIEDLQTIWDARDELASLNNESEIKSQRNFKTPASGGRHIITAIDGRVDGVRNSVITSDEVLEFLPSQFYSSVEGVESGNFRFLGLDDESAESAVDIVNFIRGYESTSLAFRSRTIDYDNDGDDDVWRLGDIVSSSPVVVGAPDAETRYDRIYGDKTYAAFYDKYKSRRQMVYVGANDGMLHAFNSGFFDPAEKSFKTSINGEVDHPLGSEMWAYVPYNLLPHLQWLADREYPHVYYVDGIPQVFDVNIFPNDADHPNGWGTILVVGMRFGGGDYELQVPNGAGSFDEVTTRSAYIVMDITNPEEPPRLIAEITHPDLGFTTGRPTVMKQRTFITDNNGTKQVDDNNWYLVFGSGPGGDDSASKTAALTNAVSAQDAKVFVFDLKNKSFVNFGAGASATSYLEVPNADDSFISDFTAVDWDEDFVDDVAYFGTISGSVTAPTGDFLRLVPGSGFSIANSNISRVLSKNSGSMERPFSGKAFVRRYKDEFWVFAGTGRFFVSKDNEGESQMGFYGVKEPTGVDGLPALNSSVSYASLVDTSDIEVHHSEGAVDSAISNRDGTTVTIEGEEIDSFSALRQVIKEHSGWRIEFDDLKARNVGKADGAGLDVAFTEYVGSGDACEPLGDTWLNQVFYQTGTAAPYSRLSISVNDQGDPISERSFEYTVGLVRDVDVVDNTFVGQGSLGNLPSPVEFAGPKAGSGRVSWREINLEW